MNTINRITSILLWVFCVSCTHADGIAFEENVQLKILSESQQTYQVVDAYSQKEIKKGTDGAYHFITPFMRIHESKFLFIFPGESYSTKDVDLLEIKLKNKVIKSLTFYEFDQLPKDENGTYLLEIK